MEWNEMEWNEMDSKGMGNVPVEGMMKRMERKESDLYRKLFLLVATIVMRPFSNSFHPSYKLNHQLCLQLSVHSIEKYIHRFLHS